MMNTMRTITKIYIAFSSNEKAMSKKDLEWMGRAKRGQVLGGGF
jgi:hypothetical protein